ncbi:MAG: YihY/virulence factor BrkB family protein [Acidimicrobiia bacterium]|nr:YihY/virulence factor BrkB family protein [Acidimicrobiia bacterium]MBT8218075.1 YihY/virulence factor BrkB family protein [Acidimicrobiia bacterium]NNF11506.1 YihY/virulence factor BrkB family protein [Acidimicrobiia bacterium]NNL69448.1 YihY/virulence factor BrkB family protein [Acidimicrobiia bacterium]
MAKTRSKDKAGLLPHLIAAAAVAARAAQTTVTGEPRTAQPPDPPPPSAPEDDGAVKRLLRRLDRYQRANDWLGFPIGVVKKFAGDKAGYLAALVAYFGFFSLFPLMLAFTSILGFVITDPEDQREFSDAAADQIPVVGDIIRDTAGSLEGSVIAIVIGLALALWSGLRIVDAMQNAMNDVWDLPRVARPKLVERRVKGLLMLAVIGGGLVGSIVASNVASLVGAIPGAGKVAIWGGTALISILLYLVGYQLLTDKPLPWRDLWPGAIFGGLAWWALQTFGSVYITNQQQSAGETYGQFASIIALFAFLFLAAQFSILGAEISVVKARRLWPRSLVPGEFTEADLQAFADQAASTQQDESYEVIVRPRSSAGNTTYPDRSALNS